MPGTATGNLPRVLLVDDNTDFLEEARSLLLSTGLCEVETLSGSSGLIDLLEDSNHAALFMDWVMPEVTGADLLPVISKRYPSLPVIVITGANDVATAVTCMKQGATDFITKPLDSSRLVSSLANALRIRELSDQNRKLQEYLLGTPLEHPESFSGIIGQSGKMLAIFKLIETFAPSRYPVFITGETGVGKELIARAVHRASGLQGEFVALNVAGIDPLMFEDTLFGHRKGAYTGAADAREGMIARAKGGTLFLDEIGDLGSQSQVKLLRLLQENEYFRLGSDLIQKSDARIVVASNRDFSLLMQQGQFREDLYHRLCSHRLHIPPLRERREDIIPLARHFSELAAAESGKPVPRISAELQIILCSHSFPGNVRELVNRINNAVVLNQSGILTQLDFPELVMSEDLVAESAGPVETGPFSLHVIFPEFPLMERVERIMIQEALKRAGGRKGMAADLLGITRQTLKKKLDDIREDEG